MNKESAALSTALIIFSVFLFSGCPQLIDLEAIDEMEDSLSPAITISSPSDGEDYTQTVVVTGTARDPGGRISSVRYEVTGTLGILDAGTISGEQLETDGSFSFQFSTVSFNGPIVISVDAEDWNDNIVSASVNLQYPGSAVSSFEAAPANKSIELSWDAVEGASDYTIYYTDNGSLPSVSYGESITVSGTSCLLENLKNGSLYTFLLKANLSGGGAYWSSYVSSIPLSSLTLSPKMIPGYGEISLEWSEIDATDEFEVLRATDPEGAFENYSGVVQSNNYTDTGVSDGLCYYYKVRPALAGSIESHANAARTFLIPPSSEDGISTISTPEPANKVKYPDWGGDYAYVAAGSAGLLIVDISTPGDPEIVASVVTTDAKDIAFYDYGGGSFYAYVADGAGKVKAINISDPLNPQLEGSYTDSLGDATSITAEAGSGRIYVIDNSGDTALLVMDVNTLPSISLVSSLSGGASYDFKDVAVSNSSGYSYIYLTASDLVTTSNYPLLEYYFTGSGFVLRGSYTDSDYRADFVDVNDDYVYVLGEIKNPMSPVFTYKLMVTGKYPSSVSTVGISEIANGFISDLTVRDNKVYAADGLGLQLIDVTSPASPVLTDFWNTPGSSTGVATDGNFCFITSGNLGFQAVDLSLPDELSVEGSYDPGDGYTALAVKDELVYAAGSDTFQILDISNPAVPVPVTGGTLSVAGARNLALSGSYAFVTTGTNGLTVIDISKPDEPDVIGSASPLSGSLGRIALKGDYAYVAGSTGLQIYDISDPTDPFGVGFYDTDGGGMNDVALRGSMAYIVQGAYLYPGSMSLLDVSDPWLPVSEGKVSRGVGLLCVSLYDDYAYVGDDFILGTTYGMSAININPSDGDYLNTPSSCKPFYDRMHDLAAFGDFAYVLLPNFGLVVIDISDPANLADDDHLRSLDWANSNPEEIVLDCGYALIADSTEGLIIIDLFP